MAVSFQRLAAVFLGGLLGAAGAFLLCGKSTFPTGGEPTEGIPVPGIMYHNVLPDGSEGLGEYVVSASELEGDLQLLKEAGYEGVTPEELFDFVRGVGTLPEKPVLLTFDDGFESMEQVVLPLLQKYSFKATAAIVGEYTDLYSGDVPKALSYSHLSWEQCRELADSGLVEIANHTYGFHHLGDGRKGLRKKKGESEETYRKVLSGKVPGPSGKGAEGSRLPLRLLQRGKRNAGGSLWLFGDRHLRRGREFYFQSEELKKAKAL